VHGSRCVVLCGWWCVVCGVWCVVCGVWCVVCGVWCVVSGVWCVRDQSGLVVGGWWLAVSSVRAFAFAVAFAVAFAHETH
jgi:hypothetical protein